MVAKIRFYSDDVEFLHVIQNEVDDYVLMNGISNIYFSPFVVTAEFLKTPTGFLGQGNGNLMQKLEQIMDMPMLDKFKLFRMDYWHYVIAVDKLPSNKGWGVKVLKNGTYPITFMNSNEFYDESMAIGAVKDVILTFIARQQS